MPFLPIDLTGGQVSGVDNLSAAAPSVINWDVDESGVNRPRAGLLRFSPSGYPASPVIGLSHWSRYVAAVYEDRSFQYFDDASPDVLFAPVGNSTLAGAARPTFALGADYIYIAGGSHIHRWAPASVELEVLADSPECTHVCQFGNRLLANDVSAPNTIRWSDIGESDFDSWPPENGTIADALPDAIVGMYTNTNEVLVFGEASVQAYGVGVDPTLPFDQISTVGIGLAAPYAAARLDENFAILDSQRRIGVTDGRSFNDISAAIHKDLRELTTISDAFAYREEHGQGSKLVFRFPTAGRTFVYDLKGQRWSERARYVSPFQGDYPVGAYAHWPMYNRHLVGLSTASGGYAELDAETRQDLTGPLVCDRMTGWQDFGIKRRKRSRCIQAIVRRGTAPQNATPGLLELRAQPEDGPWSEWQQVSVGGPGDVNQTVKWFLGGVFHRRRYEMRYSGTDELSLVELSDDVMELAS